MTDTDQGAEGATPAIIADHRFNPRQGHRPEDGYWQLCQICGLAMASHKETEVPNQTWPTVHIAPENGASDGE